MQRNFSIFDIPATVAPLEIKQETGGLRIICKLMCTNYQDRLAPSLTIYPQGIMNSMRASIPGISSSGIFIKE